MQRAVLLIGTATPKAADLLITVTAATVRPVQLRFERAPSADELHRRLDAEISDGDYLDDVHSSPAYRRHLTHYHAEQIRTELAGAAR